MSLRKNFWRFCLFEEKNKYFLYTGWSQRIFEIKKGLYNLIKERNLREIKTLNKDFYNYIDKETPIKIRPYIENKKCHVTLNFSNKCNLNCSYCYRNKNDFSELSNSEIESIFKYIINIYMPDAELYSFSFCFTSESSNDLDKLIFIDNLIAKYEGYLFQENDFIGIKPNDFFEKLPESIKNKYQFYAKNTDIIEILNLILSNEQLYDYYSYENINYVNEVLKISKKLTLSRRIMINRHIINYYFEGEILNRKIKTISMFYMTNGTNITQEFIDFTKARLNDSLCVSIDGPQKIHDLNRIYKNGNGSFNAVYNNIKLLKQNNIKIIASTVISPLFPYPYEIFSYLKSIGVDKVEFWILRSNKINPLQFSEAALKILKESNRKIYQKIFIDISHEKYGILHFFNNTIYLSTLKLLFSHKYLSTRCQWGTSIVIDSKGDLYHCNSTIGMEKDKIGHWNKNFTYKDIILKKTSDNEKRCKKCWAKYLCGGICQYESLINNHSYLDVECDFRKSIILESFKLYTKIRKLKNYEIIKTNILES